MIQKQSITINFAEGLDTKTDPWQVKPGNFLVLKNQVFVKGGRLTKRYGNRKLPSLPDATSVCLTTFNDNLTAIGSSIQALNESSSTWVSKGSIQPLELNTLPLIRNNYNQTQCDSAVSSTGLVCTVYSESNGTATTYRYAIADSATGQNIVAPTAIPVTSGTVTGSPRVFVLGNFFVVVFSNLITATYHLQYIAISLSNPTVVTTNADIASSYIPSDTLSWDGAVTGVRLFIAYNTTSGGQSVKVTYLTATNAAQGLGPATPSTFASRKATLMTVCVDETTMANPIVWVNFYRSDTSLGFALAVDQNLNTVLAATATITTGTVLNLSSAAQSGICYLFYEVSNNYSYDSSIPTHYINKYTITQAGSVSALATVVRSVGLASKAFIVAGVIYFLSAYQSSYQPTYFLINGLNSVQASPIIAGKLAYENGGGYLTLGLPGVSIIGSNNCYVAYLFKDLIAAANKDTNVSSGTQVNGIYSQTGINLATFTVGTDNISTAEIGNDLLTTGGFLWMYDGYLPVEQNFFLYPDNVEVSALANPAPTGTVANGSTIMTSVSSTTGIVAGMSITGTSISAGTTVSSISGTSITMTVAATGNNTGIYTFKGNQSAQAYYYQVTYEWSDNQGNIYRSAPSIPVTVTTSSGNSSAVLSIPTLRLTYKTANPVKIVVYRWSTAQQIYYQCTSLSTPTLNSTTSDSVSFTDVLSDAQVLGNNIIYTNGGVVENMNAPATSVITLFDNRLWMLDSENKNQFWFSKQVIQNTPVEMSDLLTYFVAPTTAAQGSTGIVTAAAPLDDKLIVFKKNAIYYIAGSGPDNTGNNNQYGQPIFVTSTVGCNDPHSIVFQPEGLQFRSDKGNWLLGRDLSTTYIGAAVEDFNTSIVQSAVNVPETNQVRFTLDTGETLMYDYFYKQWGTFVGVPAISSTIQNGFHTFLDSSGRVFQEQPNSYVDGSNPVLVSFTSGWLNLAGLQGYMRAYFFYLLGQYYSPHKLMVSVAYDYDPNPKQVSLIEPTNYNQPYGGADVDDGTNSQSPYGQQLLYGGEPRREQWRIFLKKQRCESIQISVQEIYDSSFSVAPGEGLTLSGIDLIYGVKKGFKPMAARHSVGGGTT
jgi:hypothetical protein